MNTADIKIRQLTPGDAALYRSIRLEGLKESPEAFGSTFDAEFTKPLAWFFDRLSSSVVFGAIRDAKLLDAKILGAKILGVAGFAVRDGEKEAHKGLLWGMYVRPDARGAGVARRLVEAVIAYARLGFVEYGIEKNSLKYDGRYYDEILMAMDLVSAADQDTALMSYTGAALGSNGSSASREFAD